MTFIGNNIKDFKTEKPMKDFLFIIFFAVVLFVIVYFLEYRKSNLLENSNSIYGIVKDKKTGYLVNEAIFVEFFIKNEKIRTNGIQNVKCFSHLQIGDSVLIEYSINNPKIARVLNCE